MNHVPPEAFDAFFTVHVGMEVKFSSHHEGVLHDDPGAVEYNSRKCPIVAGRRVSNVSAAKSLATLLYRERCPHEHRSGPSRRARLASAATMVYLEIFFCATTRLVVEQLVVALALQDVSLDWDSDALMVKRINRLGLKVEDLPTSFPTRHRVWTIHTCVPFPGNDHIPCVLGSDVFPSPLWPLEEGVPCEPFAPPGIQVAAALGYDRIFACTIRTDQVAPEVLLMS